MTIVRVGDSVVSAATGTLYKVTATHEDEGIVVLRRRGAPQEPVHVATVNLFTADTLERVDGVARTEQLEDVGALPGRLDTDKRIAIRHVLDYYLRVGSWHDAAATVHISREVPSWFARALRHRLLLENRQTGDGEARPAAAPELADRAMRDYAIRHNAARAAAATQEDDKRIEDAGKLLEELQALVESRYSGDSELLEKLAEAHDLVVCCE